MKIPGYIILMSVCSVISATAQSHRVVSAINKAVVPFSVITNTKGMGLYADEEGVFHSDMFSKNDTLVVYSIGYEKVILPVAGLTPTISLQPVTKMMNEVVIKSSSPVKTVPYPKKGMQIRWSSRIGLEMATRISFLPEDAKAVKKLREVNLKIKGLNEDNPCRLHIYKATSAGTPGDELLTRDILLSRKDAGPAEYRKDLTDENIYISGDAVFVGVEWIGPTKNIPPRDTNNKVPQFIPPYVRMTESIPEARTYRRVFGHHYWLLLDQVIGDKNPVNMMVSIRYQ